MGLSSEQLIALVTEAAARRERAGERAFDGLLEALREPVPDEAAARIVRSLISFREEERRSLVAALADNTPDAWALLAEEGGLFQASVDALAQINAPPQHAATMAFRLLQQQGNLALERSERHVHPQSDLSPKSLRKALNLLVRAWRNDGVFCLTLALTLEEHDVPGGDEVLKMLTPRDAESERAVLDALTDWGVAKCRFRLESALTGPAPHVAIFYLAWLAAHEGLDPSLVDHCDEHPDLRDMVATQVDEDQLIQWFVHRHVWLVEAAGTHRRLGVLHHLLVHGNRGIQDRALEWLAVVGDGTSLAVLDPLDDGWFVSTARRTAVGEAMESIRERYGVGGLSMAQLGGGALSEVSEPGVSEPGSGR